MLTIFMLVSAAVACNGNPPQPDVTTPTDSTTSVSLGDNTEPSTTVGGTQTGEETFPNVYIPEPDFDTPETLTIKVEDGKANYKVIRPQETVSASAEATRSSYISYVFLDYVGKSLDADTDWARKNDSSTLEILVGLTDYDETAAVLDEIRYGEYIVKPVGNKIVIMGYTPEALEKATEAFVNICRLNRDKATNTVTLTAEDLYARGSVNSTLNALPILGGKARATYYDAGLRTEDSGCDMMLIANTNADGYAEYTAKMESAGFTQYTSTVMGKNKFSTYTKGDYVVTLGYFPNDKSIRATIEIGAPLAGLESENKFTKVTSSQLSLLGQSITEEENGLSELIRLEDGRFIVIDGGHNGAKFANAFIAEIKNQAKKYTDNPVIAAWIITHPHVDHDGLFRQHATEIKNQGITIQNVFMNSITSQYEYDKLYAAGVNSAALPLMGSIAMCMQKASDVGATVHKVHTGQVFYFANAKIEVLSTHETQYPEKAEAVNALSLVMKFTFTDSVTGKETTFLSTGDATAKTFMVLNGNFADYIACDILSLAHHGGDVGSNVAFGERAVHTKDAYKNIKPTLALWPAGSVRWATLGQTDVRDALCETENIKEVYIAGSVGDVTVVPLPYEVGNVTGPYEWDIETKQLKK